MRLFVYTNSGGDKVYIYVVVVWVRVRACGVLFYY